MYVCKHMLSSMCTEQGATTVSRKASDNALLRIHFTRLCIDEAHFTAGDSNTVRLASQIRASARWGMSATPTRNLNHSLIDTTRNGLTADQLIATNHLSDKEDLQRLGLILGSGFLQMMPFAVDSGAWGSLIAAPFVDRAEGADRLRVLMDHCIIRNRSQDVVHHMRIPVALERRVISLCFSYIQMLSMNVLLALFVANTLLTERVGPDYFFGTNPRARKPRKELLENLLESHNLLVTDDLLHAAQNAIGIINDKMAGVEQSKGVTYPVSKPSPETARQLQVVL